METLSKLKIVLVIMITAHLLSCKNNKDEIDTRQTPVDNAVTDTTNINNGSNATGTNSTGTTGTESEGVTGAGSTSAPTTHRDQGTGTTGTGTGPGPSAKDSSTYDISSQTKNDTAKLGTKAKASKEKRIKK